MKKKIISLVFVVISSAFVRLVSSCLASIHPFSPSPINNRWARRCRRLRTIFLHNFRFSLVELLFVFLRFHRIEFELKNHWKKNNISISMFNVCWGKMTTTTTIDSQWKDRIERALKHTYRTIDLRQRRDAMWVLSSIEKLQVDIFLQTFVKQFGRTSRTNFSTSTSKTILRISMWKREENFTL